MNPMMEAGNEPPERPAVDERGGGKACITTMEDAEEEESMTPLTEDAVETYDYGFIDSKNDKSDSSSDDDVKDIPVILRKKLGKLNLSLNDRSTSLTLAEMDSDSENEEEDDNNNNNNNKPKKKPKETRSVRFGRIEYNEFRMSLGHNPCARDGLPVELSWDLVGSGEMSVDAFESTRQAAAATTTTTTTTNDDSNNNNNTKKKKEKVRTLSRAERLKIAEENHTFDSVLRIYKEVQIIQQHRQESEVEDIEHAMAQEQKEAAAAGQTIQSGSNNKKQGIKTPRKWVTALGELLLRRRKRKPS